MIVFKKDKAKWIRIIIVSFLLIILLIASFKFIMDRRYSEIVSSNVKVEEEQSNDDLINTQSQLPGALLSKSVENQAKPSEIQEAIGFSLVVLSASDQKAVILTKAGLTKLVTIGDQVGTSYEVLQVTSDKLVLKHSDEDSVYWLFEGVEAGKGRIQKFSSSTKKGEVPPSSSNGRSLESADKK